MVTAEVLEEEKKKREENAQIEAEMAEARATTFLQQAKAAEARAAAFRQQAKAVEAADIEASGKKKRRGRGGPMVAA